MTGGSSNSRSGIARMDGMTLFLPQGEGGEWVFGFIG